MIETYKHCRMMLCISGGTNRKWRQLRWLDDVYIACQRGC